LAPLHGYHEHSDTSFQYNLTVYCEESNVKFSHDMMEAHKRQLEKSAVNDMESWRKTYALVFNFLTWASQGYPSIPDLYRMQKRVLSKALINAHNTHDFEKHNRTPRHDFVRVGDTKISRDCLAQLTNFIKNRLMLLEAGEENISKEVPFKTEVKVEGKLAKTTSLTAGIVTEDLLSAAASLDSVDSKLDTHHKVNENQYKQTEIRLEEMARQLSHLTDASTIRREAGTLYPRGQDSLMAREVSRTPSPARRAVSFNDHTEVPAGIGTQSGRRMPNSGASSSPSSAGGGALKAKERLREAGLPSDACWNFAMSEEGCTYEKKTGRPCQFKHVPILAIKTMMASLYAAEPLVTSIKAMAVSGTGDRAYVENQLDAEPELTMFKESILEEFDTVKAAAIHAGGRVLEIDRA